MKKKISALLAVLMVATMFTGCVKVIKIGDEGKYTGKQEFDAVADVEGNWDEIKNGISEQAVDLSAYLTEANGDLKAPEGGVVADGMTYYAVKGSGQVKSVDMSSSKGFAEITVDGYDGPVVVKLQLGKIFKNSDSTRAMQTLVKYESVTNQVEWGSYSTALKDQVLKEVIGNVDVNALEGKTVTFVGTFGVDNNDEISIIPVELEVK